MSNAINNYISYKKEEKDHTMLDQTMHWYVGY